MSWAPRLDEEPPACAKNLIILMDAYVLQKQLRRDVLSPAPWPGPPTQAHLQNGAGAWPHEPGSRQRCGWKQQGTDTMQRFSSDHPACWWVHRSQSQQHAHPRRHCHTTPLPRVCPARPRSGDCHKIATAHAAAAPQPLTHGPPTRHTAYPRQSIVMYALALSSHTHPPRGRIPGDGFPKNSPCRLEVRQWGGAPFLWRVSVMRDQNIGH